MKKIKRLVTLLLAGVLALAMLTGCDGQTNVDLSDQLAQKATEAYAKALGVKAEEVQLTEEAAAFNKATLDRIGEDGVLPIGKDEGENDTPMLRFRNKEEKIKSVSSLIGAYKTVVSKEIHLLGNIDFSWQRSFHDHIVRSESSYENLYNYITNNPENWKKDKFYENN